ncbi:SfnB family sulfur acquisition oxidoreductase [Pseudonocardia cypriaca]|uniref:SfnB family sulfur acquisition oxidoreductase n=1 Tax=Pseudonocardia cypriaca TaxID=882449 RepID=A0A543FUE9_9PSEU|nr:SfnB family sulfur acquisition oxidoreductase [Pseudonocardia cypriaca]TQM37461.1 SfnB family sulfur acquisition oxidoreductase [Pseudonocardia cypriaca]
MTTTAVPVITGDAQALAVARDFAADLATGDSERDAQRRLPRAEVAALAASGLLGVTVPREHGGADVSARTMGELIATLSEGDASVGQIPQNHFFFVEVLREAANAAQREFFFAEVLAGRHFGNALSERGTRTPGEYAIRFGPRPGGDVLIDGTKYYATGSPFAPWIPIYANDPDGRKVAAWVPADAPGVTVVDDWHGMGQRTTGSGTVRFEQVVIPSAWVVPVWTIFERPEVFGAFGNYLHAAIDLGIARAALRDGKDLVRRIARPGAESTAARPAEDPLVIQEFGELALRVRTAAALLHEAGDAIDAARAELTVETAAEASVAVAAARAETDRAAVGVAGDVFALIGSRATANDLNLHRHWRNARTHTLHDPRRMKIQHIGNHALNDVPPPPSGLV